MNDSLKPPYLSSYRWDMWKNISNRQRNNCTEKKNLLKCSICLEPLKQLSKWDKLHLGYSTTSYCTNFTTLSCNHKFHTKCIITWLSKKDTCPICRNNIIK